MSYLTKDQVWGAIQNAPPGMTSQEVLDGLVSAGHQLEGYTPHTLNTQQMQDYQQKSVSGGIATDTGVQQENPLGMAQTGIEALGHGINEAGKFVNENIDKTTQMAGSVGIPAPIIAAALTPAATLSGVMAPQNTREKIASGALGAISLAGGPKGISNLYDVGSEALRGLASGPGGQLIGALTRVNPRFASYAIKFPEVLNGPTIREVSAKMGKFFEQFGIGTKSEDVQNLFGQDYFPNDNEVAKLRDKFLDPILEQLKSGKTPSQAELVFAERAANAITRSNPAQSNRYMMSYASGARKLLQEEMDKSGLTELGSLKKEYMGALTKDAFSDILPQNKQGSANALSTLVMAKKATDALKAASEGRMVAAAGNAAGAAAMSPFAVGQGLKVLSNPELGGMDIAGQFQMPTFSQAPEETSKSLMKVLGSEKGSLFPITATKHNITDPFEPADVLVRRMRDAGASFDEMDQGLQHLQEINNNARPGVHLITDAEREAKKYAGTLPQPQDDIPPMMDMRNSKQMLLKMLGK